MDTRDHPDACTMSFGDHLEELRKRLLLAIVAPLPVFIVLCFFSDTLLEWVLLPVVAQQQAHGLPPAVQALSPPEVLVTRLRLAGIMAIVLSAPWILYQLWLFVAPGLYAREKRFVHFLLPGSCVLTLAGVALLYFVMLPLMLHVLIAFARDVDVGTPRPSPAALSVLEQAEEIPVLWAPPPEPQAGQTWRLLNEEGLRVVHVAVDDGDGGVQVQRVFGAGSSVQQAFRISWAVNFALVLMLAIAIAFQMPLVLVLLGWVGLTSPQWLRSRRRYALLVCGVVAAVITPADALSMIMMLVPLYGLYELGILLLVLMPASAVSEGGWPWRRMAGRAGPNTRTRQPVETVQPDATVPRSPRPAQPPPDDADGSSDG